MKKLVAAAIVSCILLGSGAVFAQDTPALPVSASQSHGVSVTIPSLLMIRIVDEDSNAEVGSPDAVVFALEAGTFEPEGANAHTNQPNWSDIRVFTNAAGWRVFVETEGGSTDFDWGKVGVTPATYGAFELPRQTDARVQIASAETRTTGWLSLGIGPSSYVLTLTGDETPATYTTTVVYTIAAF